jgi:hypothetical protein
MLSVVTTSFVPYAQTEFSQTRSLSSSRLKTASHLTTALSVTVRVRDDGTVYSGEASHTGECTASIAPARTGARSG